MKKILLLKKLAMLVMVTVLSLNVYACSNDKKVENTDSETNNKKVTLNVFAAASLKISLEKIIDDYNKMYPNIEIKLNTDGSDKLYNQIKEGAPGDVFISASNKWMKEAIKNNLVDEKDSQALLNNEIVLIRNKNAKDVKLADIVDGQDLCLGAESVPVGGYSKQYFEKTGQWEKLKSDTSFEAKVTDVVKKVADGGRNYGLVYRTDANSELKNGTIEVCDVIPKDSGIKVIYPAAIIKSSKNRKEAEEFIKNLREGKAKDILEDVGFVFVE